MVPDSGSCWKKLTLHARGMAGRCMRDLFQQDPDRFSRFSLQFEDILLDYSKNLIEEETLDLLVDLARERGVLELAGRMFRGDPINTTETGPLSMWPCATATTGPSWCRDEMSCLP